MTRSVFSSAQLRRAQLRNRLAVAPMTTTQSHDDGAPSEAEARWLERLADDGYGLVLTCAAAISKSSIAFRQQLSFAQETHIAALAALARRVARPGSILIAQLCHGGARALPELTHEPARAPSRYELPVEGFVPPEALTVAQIEQIIEDFAAAAERAARAGFGGVELHGANGYLFTQFTSTMTNLRGDAWGGSLEGRARFSREVVRAVRARVGEDFVIGYRMSFEGFGLETGLDIDENAQIMSWLASDGIDYGHVSHLVFDAPSAKHPDRVALEYIRERVDRTLPLMCAGSIRSRRDAERALSLGADFVAVGRAAIGNDRVPERLARDEALRWTPFDPESLRALSVSDDFIRYLATAPPLAPLAIVARG